jgi:hypothetical protein
MKTRHGSDDGISWMATSACAITLGSSYLSGCFSKPNGECGRVPRPSLLKTLREFPTFPLRKPLIYIGTLAEWVQLPTMRARKILITFSVVMRYRPESRGQRDLLPREDRSDVTD